MDCCVDVIGRRRQIPCGGRQSNCGLLAAISARWLVAEEFLGQWLDARDGDAVAKIGTESAFESGPDLARDLDQDPLVRLPCLGFGQKSESSIGLVDDPAGLA